MRILLAVTIISQVAPVAYAADPVQVWMVGGATSCASWMQDELQGSNWLFGEARGTRLPLLLWRTVRIHNPLRRTCCPQPARS